MSPSEPAADGARGRRDAIVGVLAEHHRSARAIAQSLPAADLYAQYHPDLSPVGWHLGHCALVEHYWIREVVLGEPPAADLHDLYFPEYSSKSQRGGALPAAEALLAWTGEAHAHHLELLRDPPAAMAAHPLMAEDYLLHFLQQHYAQHLETLHFALAQRAQQVDEEPPAASRALVGDHRVSPTVELAAGEVSVGRDDVRGYDNERPAHRVAIGPVRIARHPVSNAEWQAFLESGAHADDRYWSPAGRAWRERAGARLPETWQRASGGRIGFIGPAGATAIDPAAPVTGVSHHEAEAFARWQGARLPHEHEWEAAANQGLLAETGRVWEWCANALFPYPGFRAFPYEGYSSPWFDGNHFVLRGGSAWTDPGLRRHSFRNFFEPDKRHAFCGLRLARDA